MKKKITFLGIETSCDETAAAIIQENTDGSAKVLSNVVSSQIKEHEAFGGVVPELAARSHVENIDFIINKALHESQLSIKDVDGVAATASVGSIIPNAAASVVLALDGATGNVGVVAIWGIIDDSQTPNYGAIDSSQSPNYSTITDTQTPNWEEVA